MNDLCHKNCALRLVTLHLQKSMSDSQQYPENFDVILSKISNFKMKVTCGFLATEKWKILKELEELENDIFKYSVVNRPSSLNGETLEISRTVPLSTAYIY